MMTDYFLPCNRVSVSFSPDGYGGQRSSYRLGESIRGIILPGSRSEQERGASDTSTTVRTVFHTFRSYGLSHNDVILFRNRYYRLTSDAIPVPPQSMDDSWESFICEQIHPEVQQ